MTRIHNFDFEAWKINDFDLLFNYSTIVSVVGSTPKEQMQMSFQECCLGFVCGGGVERHCLLG